MPEVILPCPACGKNSDLSVQHFEMFKLAMFRVDCYDCGVSGPSGDNEDSAIAAWNALPRALTWTHEPPKVAGWYWCSDNDDSNGYPLISHYDAWAIKEFLPKINDGKTRFKWAGPIAPPIE